MRIRRTLKNILFAISLLAVLTAAAVLGLRWWTHQSYRDKIFPNAAAAPATGSARVAIVFGAGLWSGNEPSPVLYDRIATGVELYRTGRVRKLLFTGDNRFHDHNEPAVMRRTAMEMGVPAEDIVLDYAGRRTYDSCYRARHIYDLREAVLVTQAFHLDRALYLCEAMGIESVGVAADRRRYGQDAQGWWNFREVLATAGAWGDVNVLRPVPILGERTPIR